MTNDDNIYSEWNRTLDDLGLQADDRSQQKARVVAARAQVDQAISLATIADSLDQLVAHLTGRDINYTIPEPESAASAAGLQGIQSEHDVEVGDLVSPLGSTLGKPLEVGEVGVDQGKLWLKLGESSVKNWASQFVVVGRAADAEPEPVSVFEAVVASMTPVDAPDDIDDDFATAASDADEQQADALAALRARQGKGKKATRKP